MVRNRCASPVWRATAPVLAVHGGAGRIVPEEFSAERVATARRGLGKGLTAGMTVLREGGSALDAVVAAVLVLEDDEQFNAGRGAVLTAAGGVEHDAAVADGATRRAGAVTCVSGIRNPVLAARAVLERTPHVLMSGAGAQELAHREGLTFMPTDWFMTARRREQLTGIPPSSRVESESTSGTVGAVALDGARMTHGTGRRFRVSRGVPQPIAALESVLLSTLPGWHPAVRRHGECRELWRSTSEELQDPG
ncbi:MAG TPA: isoaspartyl peptidase/L-asparaginase [Pseudonocardiaceae bacterium]|nr:isoaspartyl peptidase/L-asparaginase [Pseudonocardiaceae bacterium]